MKPRKLRKILVPIDYSKESMKTLRVAKLLAERWRAQLDLVHVVPPSPPAFATHHVMFPIAPSTETQRAELRRLEDFAFEQSVQPLRYSCIVRRGAAAEKINETARKTGADLIAIATRGFTGLKYAFLGSTTAEVVRTARCPVLVVRELEYVSSKERARRGRTPLQFEKLLVLLDFSDCSRVGLDYALDVARDFRSSVLLFHSIIVQTYTLGHAYTSLQAADLIKLQQEHAQESLGKLRRELSSKFKVETAIGLGSTVEQINKCVRSHRVDLIITSTHGRTGLKRLFIGSTAEQIVRHAICPVLVVPNRPAQQKLRKRG
jgi:nucleotide-binding universal stress UspA family protein